MSTHAGKKGGVAGATTHQEVGFFVSRGAPNVMGVSHSHADIEFNFVSRGAMEYFASGRFHLVSQGELAVFWAGMPHQLVRVEPQTECVWAAIPLSWLMQWRLPEHFAQRLLHGAFIGQTPAHEYSCDADRALFEGWARDLNMAHSSSSGLEMQRIVALEIEARLRRLALCDEGREDHFPIAKGGSASDATGAQVERIAAFLSQNYREELTAAQIARAVGLHPNYAMQLFKSGCGLSLWDYLMRLRVSHAQRLLLTTDLTIEHIASESGFASRSRFYAAFKDVCGQSPRAFRRLGMPSKL